MSRLMAKSVFIGLVTACRLAGSPTSRSPSSVNATIEGVVLDPSAFSSTFGLLPSMTATHELVVPRSIPMTLAISQSSCLWQTARTQNRHPDPEGPHTTHRRRSPCADLRVVAYIVGPLEGCNVCLLRRPRMPA